MNQRRFFPLFCSALGGLCLIGLLFLVLTMPAWSETATLDGQGDAVYGPPLATDPDDLVAAIQAVATTCWTEVYSLYVTNDTRHLYVFVPLPDYVSTAGSGSTGSFGLVIASGVFTASGGTAPKDPWGNDITLAYTATQANAGSTPILLPYRIIPDAIIRGNIVGKDCCGYSDNGWTELRRWNGSNYDTGGGSNWGGLSGGALIGTHVALADHQGVEFAIPWSDLGIAYQGGRSIYLQFWTTQSGSVKGAYDTVPNDDQSTGWDDPTVQRFLATFTLINAQDAVITSPGEGQHFTRPDVTVRGYVTPTDQVTLTLSVNGSVLLTPTLDAQGYFTQAITLLPGHNTITATAASTVGIGVDVRRLFYGPNLVLTAPVEGQHTFAPDAISISGQASPGEDITVTVQLGSGTPITVAVNPADGTFAGSLVPPGSGLYTLVVTASNASGATRTTRQVSYGAASPDGNIWWGCLGHNTHDLDFRDPFGAVSTASTVTLRLCACPNDLTGAVLHIYYHDKGEVATLPMTLSTSVGDPRYAYWEAIAAAPSTTTLMYYKFEAVDGVDRDWYVDDTLYDGRNGWGRAVDENPAYDAFRITVYHAGFTTPDWIKNATVYQIFPDRFRDGVSANNVVSGTRFVYTASQGINYPVWNTAVINPRDPASPYNNRWSQDFYGGDLQGITAKLDYLQSMGVTALYLNPIFAAPSNHKYDTTSFEVVDAQFGGDAALRALLDAAAARGMYVILDGVFNHTSSDSIYFDKYSRWSSVGAFESQASPYYNWYTFNAWPDNYVSWWGYDTLPKLKSNTAAVRSYFWGSGATSIGARWVLTGTAGWRLDVGGDVDSGAPDLACDNCNDYWEGFRQTVKNADPQAVIIGEEWGDAVPWLLGQEWDSVMNYRFRSALLSFMRDKSYWDNDNNSSSSGGTLNPITVSQFDRWLRQIQEDYPAEAWYAMMNLVGSHDTNRLRFVLSKWQKGYDSTDPQPYDPLTDLDAAETDARQMLLALLQFTMPGAPTVYYADEAGIDAPAAWHNDKWEDDPYNRVPYPWADTLGHYAVRQDVLDRYALLGQIRLAHPALRTGSFDTLLTDDAHQVYVYGRKLPGVETAIVVINRQNSPYTVTVDLGGYVSAGTVLREVLYGGVYTVGVDGRLTLPVGALDGRVLSWGYPNLNVSKTAAPTTNLERGDTITFTLTTANIGFEDARGVVLTDVLPVELTFGGWVAQNGATVVSRTVTWHGDVSISAAQVIVFTATLTGGQLGQTITNTVMYVSTNAGAGSDEAAWRLRTDYRIYLPVVLKNAAP